MRKTVLAALFAGGFLSMPVFALDLMQVYQEARSNDAQFAAARAALEAGQERGVQGRAGLLPVVGVSGDRSRTELPGASSSVDANRYEIALSQPLFRMANWQAYQQGKLSVAASEALFAQARQDLILRVSEAYFAVLTAEDTLASVQAQKTAITEQLASAKRNFEVGTATITDTHEAQARYDLVIAQEFAAQNELEIRRAALQQIVGRPVVDLAPLRTGVKLTPPTPTQVNEWVEAAQQQNFGVVAQDLVHQIAQRQIKLNRAGHYPTVDLVARRNHTDVRTQSTLPGNTDTVALNWNIPLFSGFAVTSRVREAIALEDQERAELENAKRVAALNARQAFLGVNAGLAQVRALEAAELSSKSALDSNRLGYQVGVRINIDVLNAQQQLFETRRDLARARYETILNGLRLKSAAGSLGEEDVSQVNALLGR